MLLPPLSVIEAEKLFSPNVAGAPEIRTPLRSMRYPTKFKGSIGTFIWEIVAAIDV